MQKTFIGPHLRRLRTERGETQGAMAPKGTEGPEKAPLADCSASVDHRPTE